MQQYSVDKELQGLELEILKEFHAVCEKHGLCYYLVYGTMLGAVRHQGFIPWDDDIDVAMPREAYEILRCNADKWFPGWLKFCCYQNSLEYPYNLAKLEHQNWTGKIKVDT